MRRALPHRIDPGRLPEPQLRCMGAAAIAAGDEGRARRGDPPQRRHRIAEPGDAGRVRCGPISTKSLYITGMARPAKPSATKRLLRRPVMHQHGIGIAAPADIQRLAGAERHHPHPDPGRRVKSGRIWPNRPDCSVEVVEARVMKPVMKRACAAAGGGASGSRARTSGSRARREERGMRGGATPGRFPMPSSAPGTEEDMSQTESTAGRAAHGMQEAMPGRIPDRIPLARIITPRSVAVIGASDDVGKFGGRVIHYLIRHGYPGRLLPINPNRAEIRGLPAFPGIGAAPGPVDVAILAVPAAALLRQVEDCAAAGVGACIIITGKLADAGAAGAALQKQVLAVARAAGMRLVGPNCLGIFNMTDAAHALLLPGAGGRRG